jgi:hypothetical protein
MLVVTVSRRFHVGVSRGCDTGFYMVPPIPGKPRELQGGRSEQGHTKPAGELIADLNHIGRIGVLQRLCIRVHRPELHPLSGQATMDGRRQRC